jgi:hypothetical protein
VELGDAHDPDCANGDIAEDTVDPNPLPSWPRLPAPLPSPLNAGLAMPIPALSPAPIIGAIPRDPLPAIR